MITSNPRAQFSGPTKTWAIQFCCCIPPSPASTRNTSRWRPNSSLANLPRVCSFQITDKHLGTNSITLEDKQQHLMGVTILHHQVHYRPAVLDAEGLTVLVASSRQYSSLRGVAEYWMRQQILSKHPGIARHAPIHCRMNVGANTILGCLLHNVQRFRLINILTFG